MNRRLISICLVIGLAACGAQSPDHAAPTAPKPQSRGMEGFEGVGRTATEAEIAAWDIDVRPDFKGLPVGSGTVEDGEELWIEKCTSCHGDFGDANHVFVPLVGNTTSEDIKNGRVAALAEGGKIRTTFTKVSTVSTLWDYIYRAMPWDAPKSLSPDDVYAILAYLLNLAEIVPYDYELSNENIAEVQAKMPNRNGMTRDHGLWKIDGEPDTHNTRCMNDCVDGVTLSSQLPEYARDAHGNLADQNRTYGPVRGAVTVEAPNTGKEDLGNSASGNSDVIRTANDKGCMACHGRERKIIGPALAEVAAKHVDKNDVAAYLKGKIKEGGSGVWGEIPMPPQPALSEEEATALAEWVAGGAAP